MFVVLDKFKLPTCAEDELIESEEEDVSISQSLSILAQKLSKSINELTAKKASAKRK